MTSGNWGKANRVVSFIYNCTSEVRAMPQNDLSKAAWQIGRCHIANFFHPAGSKNSRNA